MKILVATKAASSSWQRIAILNVRKDGRFTRPKSLLGTAASALMASGVRTIASDPAISDVFLSHGSIELRCTRVV